MLPSSSALIKENGAEQEPRDVPGVSLARVGGLLLSQCKASPVGSCKRHAPPVVAHALSKMG